MEVEVLMYVEHPITGKQSFCCRALLKFVALDRKRRPRPVPELIPETKEEVFRVCCEFFHVLKLV